MWDTNEDSKSGLVALTGHDTRYLTGLPDALSDVFGNIYWWSYGRTAIDSTGPI